MDGLNGTMGMCTGTNGSSGIGSTLQANNSIEFGRKGLSFSPDHVQCLCEALQQRGDVEKLATFLWNLPTNELFRSNESVLR